MLGLAAAGPALAQNVIRQEGWEGFATRTPEGRFEQCVLYNRTIQALTASPSNMIGITRDAAGKVGLIAFFEPRSLTRAESTPMTIRIDQHPAVTVSSSVLSDFHAATGGGLDAATVTALRTASTVTVTVEQRALHLEIADVAGVLDTLEACVAANSR